MRNFSQHPYLNLICSQIENLKGRKEIDPKMPLNQLDFDSLDATLLQEKLNYLGYYLPTPIFPWDSAISISNKISTVQVVSVPKPDAPIAVIGMACRFPNATSPRAFWNNLTAGRNSITRVPKNRDFLTSDKQEWISPWGAFLDNISEFDPSFFGIKPLEARQMDPQQRLCLELAWEALLDAAIDPDSTRGGNHAIFIGAMWADYARLCSNHEIRSSYAATGGDLSIIAGRLAYTLDWQGASLCINTASSSSLAAIHQACKNLLSGASEMALAGGVNLILDPHTTAMMTRLGTQSKKGACSAFSNQADGYVRGEGAGLVLLKPLAAAIRDGDPIRAVINGSALTNDGATGNLMTPSADAQEKAIRKALDASGLEANQVHYVECHGTGTPVGDPIEAEALGRVYGKRRDADLVIGSVKTNLGHLEAAAGVAGFIKGVLMLENRIIPQSLNGSDPNENIPFKDLGLSLANGQQSWPEAARARLGVSSFGFGGVNCHLILSEWQTHHNLQFENPPQRDHHLLMVSAHNSDALRTWTRTLAQTIGPDTNMAELCRMAALGRDRQVERMAVSGSTPMELKHGLEAFANRLPVKKPVFDGEMNIAFVFPVQGGQWPGMGLDLLAREPVFKKSLEQFEEALKPHVAWSLFEKLSQMGKGNKSEPVDVVQPLICAIQIALADLLISWGLKPQAIVGHSMGEVAGAAIAGAISLKDAARIITARSQTVRSTSGQGAMVVVELSEEEAEFLVRGMKDTVVSAVNGPRSVLLSTTPESLLKLTDLLEEKGLFCKPVKVDYASHSPQMDPLLPQLKHILAEVQPQKAKIPIQSTSKDALVDGSSMDAHYWAANLRNPVRFYSRVEALMDAGFTHFVEISPHPVLSYTLNKISEFKGVKSAVISTMKRHSNGQRDLMTCLGNLFCSGMEANWKVCFPGPKVRIHWPDYPFQRKRYWFDDTLAQVCPLDSVKEPETLARQLSHISKRQGLVLLEQFISDCCIQILEWSPTEPPDPHKGFRQLGMDSLMGVCLRDILSQALERPFPAALTFDHPTIHALTHYLGGLFFPESENSEQVGIERSQSQDPEDEKKPDDDLVDGLLNELLLELT